MLADEFAWGTGDVEFWDLAFLDPERPLAEQVDDLKEDLALVRYAGAVLVDIGWYPSFAEDGAFVVRVVHEDDWDQPLLLEKHASVRDLLPAIQRAVLAADAASAAQRGRSRT